MTKAARTRAAVPEATEPAVPEFQTERLAANMVAAQVARERQLLEAATTMADLGKTALERIESMARVTQKSMEAKEWPIGPRDFAIMLEAICATGKETSDGIYSGAEQIGISLLTDDERRRNYGWLRA